MEKPPPTNRVLKANDSIGSGRYRLVRKLGAGGNGVVWLAEHAAMGSRVVVKFPNSGAMKDESGREQFEQEVRALVSFSDRHPNIVNILDAGYHHGKPFVVMQYLTNGSLQSFLFGMPGYNSPEASRLFASARWVFAIADALDCLHSNGLVHRDVKPGNILLDESFSAYLADFGIATLASSGLSDAQHENTHVVGSLPYIAPEILRGEKPASASDQFSLAVSVYEYLSGQLPYRASSCHDLVEQHKDQLCIPLAETRPDVPSPLWQVLRRALATDPDARFDSCGVFAQQLEARWPNWAMPTGCETQPKKRALPLTETQNDPPPVEDTEIMPNPDHEKRSKQRLKLSRFLRE